MPDCDSPKCHEHMNAEMAKRPTWEEFNPLKDEVERKMPKSWLRWFWLAIVAIGFPLFVSGLSVWSGQESDRLRYAENSDIVECQIRLKSLEDSDRYLRRDLDEIKTNVNEILRIMQKKQE